MLLVEWGNIAHAAVFVEGIFIYGELLVAAVGKKHIL